MDLMKVIYDWEEYETSGKFSRVYNPYIRTWNGKKEHMCGRRARHSSLVWSINIQYQNAIDGTTTIVTPAIFLCGYYRVLTVMEISSGLPYSAFNLLLCHDVSRALVFWLLIPVQLLVSSTLNSQCFIPIDAYGHGQFLPWSPLQW